MRNRLLSAARRISANRSEQPATPLVAMRKIFLQERRDWKRPGATRTGWKRGEIAEFAQALLAGDLDAAREEWGDVGYYVAQIGGLAWWVYERVTPKSIIESACTKFERRANGRA